MLLVAVAVAIAVQHFRYLFDICAESAAVVNCVCFDDCGNCLCCLSRGIRHMWQPQTSQPAGHIHVSDLFRVHVVPRAGFLRNQQSQKKREKSKEKE